MMRPTTWRIPAEIRRQIAAQPATLGSRIVAELFGVSKRTVTNIRREAGVPVAGRGTPAVWGKQLQAKSPKTIMKSWPLRRRGPKPLDWAMEGAR